MRLYLAIDGVAARPNERLAVLYRTSMMPGMAELPECHRPSMSELPFSGCRFGKVTSGGGLFTTIVVAGVLGDRRH